MANLKAEISAQDNLSSTLKNIQDELKKTGQTASGIDKIQEKFEKIQNSSAPLKRQLRDLQAIMAKMNMNGLSNTEQFTQIAEYAGKLKDAISDASNAVSRYASDTSNLDAMASAFAKTASELIKEYGLLSECGIFIVESDADTEISTIVTNMTCIKSCKYGSTLVTFFVE